MPYSAPIASLNSKNLLSGLTPTFANFAVNPGTSAELVDELTDSLTTAGTKTGTNQPTIKYDLGSSIRILASFHFSPSTGSEPPSIEISDDDSNWYIMAAGAANMSAYSHNCAGVGKGRYIRFAINRPGTNASTTYNQIRLRAYRI